VLVVAPDDHHVGTELVEQGTLLAEVVEQGVAVSGRAGGSAVVGVLGAHGGGPARGVAESLGEAGVLEDAAQDAGHVLVQAGERRIVRHAQPEDLGHEMAPGIRVEALAEPYAPVRALVNLPRPATDRR